MNKTLASLATLASDQEGQKPTVVKPLWEKGK